MEPNISEIAQRIFAMRDLCGYSVEEMSEYLDVSTEEYEEYESGMKDFSFTFLYKCAEKFGIDIIELLTGDNPHLSDFTVVKKGRGLPMRRRQGFEYLHLAANFKNKLAEPFVVTAPYREEDQNSPIPTSTHVGQEFDIVLEGSLRFVFEDHVVDLAEGDSVYYNSGKPHGMIATSKKGCKFLAIVMKDSEKQ